ncbi:HD-GYP domain-containing protein [Clostridium brassicae]|uniref:HD-GYP domain-containing protein n=1 Tax=Clostridium brassicae TaxID=2999072 RepID=A0ABT4DAQ3_9CLOT|nr:HD-GYP domain-containing protein [Clostridium brassicae]MCY6959387.1 HD-GYP domain-containing protein [Clostridium brassicae]
MRFVPANCLREGMKLGRNVYSNDNVVLLAKDVILTEKYIKDIHKLVINGVYIEDALSENIRIENIISEGLRINAVKSIKKIYNNPKNIGKTLDSVEHIAKNMMHEILNSKSIMINMIDIKTYDDYMYSHSVNVGVLCAVMGIGLNLEETKIQKLITSALLHDIGKVFIPKEVIDKKENLTNEEKKIIQSHSEKGYRYIKQHYNVPITSYVGILQHHERYDGKGYPDGKKAEAISIFGRIIRICDAYDNLITETPTKKAYLPSDAIEYIMAYNGTIFDPKLVKIFLKKVAPYPLGTIVILSNGKKGIVVKNNEECSTRPIIKLIPDEDEENKGQNKHRNLHNTKEYKQNKQNKQSKNLKGKESKDLEPDENKGVYDLLQDWNYRNVTIVGVEQ